ncbi:microsomal prostaglandin e synthase-2 [Holotrichia oblita]|uniref:Microsomal prostaglandin e synthase-2 n=1 Tax=Holotrichia oblita TaxID=644536 RepID=A0ACB9TVM9_HOLOL|nr:microsomal prostaglandin e synthase-2 [Holotrichia oblita]
MGGVKQKASWTYLIQLYEWDKPRGYFSTFTKLTDAHVLPSKINKMKVSCCAQVFGNSVGKFMQCLIDAESSVLPKEAEGTAKLFLFLNKLFDSFNGVNRAPSEENQLKCAISTSAHKVFWHEAISVITSMKFQERGTEKLSRPPSLKNWVWTIRGMQYIWDKLSANGWQYLIPRHFNQDAIENFFSCIRAHGVRNVNPMCTSFITSFKTLTLNNFCSPKSISANCEDDLSTGA